MHVASTGLTTVLFHGVRGAPPAHGWDTYARFNPSSDAFRRQVRFLTRRFTPVSLKAVRAWVADGEPLPPRALLVTFDDGYRALTTTCAPVLMDHGVPAVVFVLSGALERSHMPWFIPFDRLMRRAPGRPVDWRGRSWAYTSPAQLREFTAAVKDVVYAAPASAHRSLVEDLAVRVGLAPVAVDELFAWDLDDDMQLMSYADLAQWRAAGLDIGAHSHTHSSMAFLTGAALWDEMLGCRERLRRAGVEAASFAYPDGRFGEQAMALAREHFAVAFGVHVPPVQRGPATLPRRCIGGEPLRELWLEVAEPPAAARWLEERATNLLARFGVRLAGWH